ncbi:Zinc/iron permease [Catenaria anguillulae PL171]|uniref:Zinc/iron permease n=1 Tax=Catenaria anguillulae PL171 TaxID=765915 RepID=A0A1Y2I1S4_9FUNG|nr:Zinc/iron permease [Catenaria anguillulae PL171]
MAEQPHDYDTSKFPLVFLVSLGAGLATGIGAASVRFGSIRNPKFLSGGMALAAGVMLYVSLHEILAESIHEFEAAWPEETHPGGKARSYLFGTLFFFLGAILTVFLDIAVHKFQHAMGVTDEIPTELILPESSDSSIEKGNHKNNEFHPDHPNFSKARLLRTALITGIAISVHNLPEGLATFVSMAKNFSVGAPLAIAIAVHNIPEGIAVAIPILFATGSRMKAFLWGTATGLSEPIGALIGWAILANTATADMSFVYGCLFGIIGGMMTYIAIAELIPTALHYHPNQRTVAITVFAGMLVMAISLVMFQVAEM